MRGMGAPAGSLCSQERSLKVPGSGVGLGQTPTPKCDAVARCSPLLQWRCWHEGLLDPKSCTVWMRLWQKGYSTWG